jgi:hypothetical protein
LSVEIAPESRQYEEHTVAVVNVKALGKNIVGVFVTGLMLLMLVSVHGSSAGASEPHPLNSMWVDPTAVCLDAGNASLGVRFNVTVWANMESGSFCWQVYVTFNASQLQAVRVWYSAYYSSQFFYGHSTMVEGPIINNTDGSIMLGESLIGMDVASATVGSLCLVEFEVVKLPSLTSLTSVVNIDNDGTFFLDDNLNVMSKTKSDGVYSIDLTGLAVALTDVTVDGTWVYQGSNIGINVSVMNSTTT